MNAESESGEKSPFRGALIWVGVVQTVLLVSGVVPVVVANVQGVPVVWWMWAAVATAIVAFGAFWVMLRILLNRMRRQIADAKGESPREPLADMPYRENRIASLHLLGDDLLQMKPMLSGDTHRAYLFAEELLIRNSELHKETWVLSNKAVESAEDVHRSAEAIHNVTGYIHTVAEQTEQVNGRVNDLASAGEDIRVQIEEVNQHIGVVTGSMSQVGDVVGQMDTLLKDVQDRCQLADREAAAASTRVGDTVE
ncbi:MAG: methyl-accepting chemotaxis protein, partial [Magnetococcales bacterium]|nr:methyl-accepting chemotaxis protein [Magnetococcales bacterium]